MADLAKELERVILKAGIDGALTEDAVAQFHSLVKERDSLKTALVESDANYQKADEERRVQANLAHEREQQLNAWATREKELKDREDSVLRKEIEAEMNEKRVQDHKHMFETVFKGIHMRKQVVTPGSSTVDQYGTKTDNYPDTTEAVDQE